VAGTQDYTHDQSELQLYQPSNVIVSGGILDLTAQKQQVSAGGNTYQYTSGMISSGPAADGAPSRFAYTYGYLETRAKVPDIVNPPIEKKESPMTYSTALPLTLPSLTGAHRQQLL